LLDARLTGLTPILDRVEAFPAQVTPSRSKRTLGVLVGAACGVILGLIAANPPVSGVLREWFAREIGPSLPDEMTPLTAVTLFFSAFVAFFAGIIVHEAGHAIVGRLAGFHVSSIRVGRLQLDLPFSFSLYRGTGTGAGGWVTLVPVKRDTLALRAAVMTAAGPMANLISAAVLGFLPFEKGFGVRFFILFSVGLGAINLVPFRSRALVSDGRRILMLLGNRARGERWVAILKLVADLAEGTRAESLSREYIGLATAVRDNTSDTVTAHAIAYSSAFHRHQDDEAARMLETAMRYAGYAAPIMRQALMTDAAVFQARRRKRADLAEAWRGAMPRRTEIPWLHDLATAGVLEAHGDIAGALAALDRAEGKIRAESNKLRRDLSLRAIERWRSDLDELRTKN
jgi:hypothetical protein